MTFSNPVSRFLLTIAKFGLNFKRFLKNAYARASLYPKNLRPVAHLHKLSAV